MSYDISLTDPVTHETLEFDTVHQMRGGTYAIGGSREMHLNVTYNYARWYYIFDVFGETEGDYKGIRTIYGKTGLESITILKNAISVLENMDVELTEEEVESYKNSEVEGYWMPTRENSIKPLYQLLTFAQARPDGVWEGD